MLLTRSEKLGRNNITKKKYQERECVWKLSCVLMSPLPLFTLPIFPIPLLQPARRTTGSIYGGTTYCQT